MVELCVQVPHCDAGSRTALQLFASLLTEYLQQCNAATDIHNSLLNALVAQAQPPVLGFSGVLQYVPQHLAEHLGSSGRLKRSPIKISKAALSIEGLSNVHLLHKDFGVSKTL